MTDIKYENQMGEPNMFTFGFQPTKQYPTRGKHQSRKKVTRESKVLIPEIQALKMQISSPKQKSNAQVQNIKPRTKASSKKRPVALNLQAQLGDMRFNKDQVITPGTLKDENQATNNSMVKKQESELYSDLERAANKTPKSGRINVFMVPNQSQHSDELK